MGHVLVIILAASCTGLVPPVSGPVVAGFAPAGRYAGHWGVDFAVPIGSPVRAAGIGVVTYSGRVVDNTTVTVDHGGGVRTSYSFLSGRAVATGERVGRAAVIGSAGGHRGHDGVHFSVRVHGVYVDPARVLGVCRSPGHALRLHSVFGRSTYPRRRARHPRRHLRPASSRPSRSG